MRIALASAFLCLMSSSHSFAQEGLSFGLHKNSVVVNSEAVLSGIDLYTTSVERIIERFGQATRVKQTKDFTRLEWEADGCQLTVVASDSWIDTVQLRGTRPDCAFGSSGHGLKLGDNSSDVRRIYPPSKYFLGFQFPGYPRGCPVSPRLEIEMSPAGAVNAMKLSNGAGCY